LGLLLVSGALAGVLGFQHTSNSRNQGEDGQTVARAIQECSGEPSPRDLNPDISLAEDEDRAADAGAKTNDLVEASIPDGESQERAARMVPLLSKGEQEFLPMCPIDRGHIVEMQPPAEMGPMPPPPFKRRRTMSEIALRHELSYFKEVRPLTLETIEAMIQTYRTDYQSKGQTAANIDWNPSVLLRIRPDLRYLPVRSGGAVQLDDRAARTLGLLSRKLRGLLDRVVPKDGNDKRPDPVLLTETLKEERKGNRPEWLRPEAIPVMLQLLMHEEESIRLMLVELLSDIPGKAASVALGQRAVFDLSGKVREAAIQALQTRPREEYRQVFLDALRYPWAPVADHAAEALVALKDRDAAPLLATLLKRPDPQAPVRMERTQLGVPEVVQIHHEANCMLCHPPTISAGGLVARPYPGVILFSGGSNPDNSNAAGGYGIKFRPAKPGPLWIRFDVTFLRQDFSIQKEKQLPTGLTTHERIDYLVRLRPLKEKEVRELRPKDPTAYEQREAVLWALRELTGQDPGSASEDWLQLFPRAELDLEIARLTAALIQAPATRKMQLLTKYKTARGEAYTEAIAAAIPKLPVRFQKEARKMLDELLDDPEPEVARAAEEALQKLAADSDD
jgi:hypothetical protein